MNNFSRGIIKFFNDDFKELSLRKFDFIKNDEHPLIFSHNKDYMLKALFGYSKIYKEHQNEIVELLETENKFDLYYKMIMNYLSFFISGSKIYKFSNDFLNDYMNYDLNFDSIINNNKISFNSDSIWIYAENIFESLDKKEKYNLINVSKMKIHETKKGVYSCAIDIAFRNINNGIYFCTSRYCFHDFNLIDIYKYDSKGHDNSRSNEYIEHIDLMIKNVIKLMLYIQSSNVDLRKISPEISMKNTRKERDRANTNNIKNDSLIDYFKVGYGWNKLPVYTLDQWSVRGHFRLQPFGENRQNHKIIFIEPQVRKRKSQEIEANL